MTGGRFVLGLYSAESEDAFKYFNNDPHINDLFNPNKFFREIEERLKICPMVPVNPM